MSENMLQKEFSVCKNYIKKKSWDSLKSKLSEFPLLKSYSIIDDSLLSYARSIGDSSMMDVVRCGVDADIAYSDGTTMLMDYTALGNVEMVLFLINNGSNVNKLTHKGESAFTFACANDQLLCAKELCRHGADISLSIGPSKTTTEDLVNRFGSKEFKDWMEKDNKSKRTGQKNGDRSEWH